MSDLRRLPPAEARKLLALAGAIVAKRNREQSMVVWLEGPVVNEKTTRAACRRILAEKRRAAGMLHVDFTHLFEGRDDLTTK